MACCVLVSVVGGALMDGGLLLAPALLAGLSVAFVVGVLQSATGIQEPLIGMVPRLVVMVAVIFITGGWMIERFVSLFQASVLSP